MRSSTSSGTGGPLSVMDKTQSAFSEATETFMSPGFKRLDGICGISQKIKGEDFEFKRITVDLGFCGKSI